MDRLILFSSKKLLFWKIFNTMPNFFFYMPSLVRKCLLFLFINFVSASGLATTLNIQNGGQVRSLDPHQISGLWENRVIGDLFEGLYTYDQDANVVPGMAQSHKVSDDGLTYTFYLRDNVAWSDGIPVTAHDFLFGFQRLLDPSNKARNAKLLYQIKNAQAIHTQKAKKDTLGVHAIDDSTLEIVLTQPDPFFLSRLVHYTASPLPKHIIEQFGDKWTEPKNYVSNGAYKLGAWKPGNYLSAQRNQFHYDINNIAIDEVVYHALEDPTVSLLGFLNKQYDIIYNFPHDDLSQLKNHYGKQLRIVPTAGLYFLTLNHLQKPFSDARVRKALSMLIDRDRLSREVLKFGQKPAYSWVPALKPDYPNPATFKWINLSYKERQEQARKLLVEVGISKTTPITMTINVDTVSNQEYFDAITKMYEPFGVILHKELASISKHYDKLLSHNFTLGRASWTMDFGDPHNILFLLEKDSSFNFGNFYDKKFEQLVMQAQSQADMQSRLATLKKAEQIILDQDAAIPLFFLTSTAIVAKNIQGYNNNLFNIHRTRYLVKI